MVIDPRRRRGQGDAAFARLDAASKAGLDGRLRVPGAMPASTTRASSLASSAPGRHPPGADDASTVLSRP